MLEKFNIGGKSGAPLYFSHDMKFVIKAVPADEYDFVSSFMEPYVDYMIREPDSLIMRVHGLHATRTYLTPI